MLYTLGSWNAFPRDQRAEGQFARKPSREGTPGHRFGSGSQFGGSQIPSLEEIGYPDPYAPRHPSVGIGVHDNSRNGSGVGNINQFNTSSRSGMGSSLKFGGGGRNLKSVGSGRSGRSGGMKRAASQSHSTRNVKLSFTGNNGPQKLMASSHSEGFFTKPPASQRVLQQYGPSWSEFRRLRRPQ